MKLLYLGAHSILEYYELSVFAELGIDFFCLGSYVDPKKPVDKIRPPLNVNGNKRWMDMKSTIEKNRTVGDPKFHGIDMRDNIPKEFIDEFDVIYVMHVPRWVKHNWDKFSRKIVIWRTIGQSNTEIEMFMQEFRQKGVKIIRYSPKERTIPGYAGEDVVIRFPIDKNEFSGWTGEEKNVLTICQSIKGRAEACNFFAYEKSTKGLPRKLFGRSNEDVEYSGGEISFERMKEEMKKCGVYFCTNTKPASYTLNFCEALMTGIPVVALGDSWGNSFSTIGADSLYEIPSIFQSEEKISGDICGITNDNLFVLNGQIRTLLENKSVADTISKNGRRLAIKLFDKDMIKQQFKEFFNTL